MQYLVYGAQGMALAAYRAIHLLFPEKIFLGFLVTQQGNNAKVLANYPVLTLHEFAEQQTHAACENIEIYIATPEDIIKEIQDSLEQNGFLKYHALDSLAWADLMERYFERTQKFLTLHSLPCGESKAELSVFMAKFYKDKPLQTKYDRPDWMREVQAGAALTKERVAELTDNLGDSISEQNKNYSELTVLYWMWKNCILKEKNCHKYYGLSHYRRILNVSERDMMRLTENEVDVVLPYPMPYDPNIHEHHKRYLSECDWEMVCRAVEELQPMYAKEMTHIFEQDYLYNYNIFIATAEATNAYCEWLFPLLKRIDELCNSEGIRADRYIGYVAESLNTLYHFYHQKDLKIVHTGCRFLI